MKEQNEAGKVAPETFKRLPKVMFKGEINFDTKDNVSLPVPKPNDTNTIDLYIVNSINIHPDTRNVVINPDGSELRVYHKDTIVYDYSKGCWISTSEMVKNEEPAKTLNTLLVDYNITCRTMNDIEEYLNEEEIPYVVRVDRDDTTDVEFHITADDIPVECNFKFDMNIVGSVNHVEKYIIYNK